MTALPTFPLAPAEKMPEVNRKASADDFQVTSFFSQEIHDLGLGSVTTSEKQKLPIDEPEHMQVTVIKPESKRLTTLELLALSALTWLNTTCRPLQLKS